jgi:hypothetical protein
MSLRAGVQTQRGPGRRHPGPQACSRRHERHAGSLRPTEGAVCRGQPGPRIGGTPTRKQAGRGRLTPARFLARRHERRRGRVPRHAPAHHRAGPGPAAVRPPTREQSGPGSLLPGPRFAYGASCVAPPAYPAPFPAASALALRANKAGRPQPASIRGVPDPASGDPLRAHASGPGQPSRRSRSASRPCGLQLPHGPQLTPRRRGRDEGAVRRPRKRTLAHVNPCRSPSPRLRCRHAIRR